MLQVFFSKSPSPILESQMVPPLNIAAFADYLGFKILRQKGSLTLEGIKEVSIWCPPPHLDFFRFQIFAAWPISKSFGTTVFCS